jgi:hypothetical protein
LRFGLVFADSRVELGAVQLIGALPLEVVFMAVRRRHPVLAEKEVMRRACPQVLGDVRTADVAYLQQAAKPAGVSDLLTRLREQS